MRLHDLEELLEKANQDEAISIHKIKELENAIEDF